MNQDRARIARARRKWVRLVRPYVEQGANPFARVQRLLEVAERAKEIGVYSDTTYVRDVAMGILSHWAKQDGSSHRWGWLDHTGWIVFYNRKASKVA